MEISKVKINSLILQPREECMLYRYLTIDKLIDFLINHRIPLVRLNVFQDKLEGASLEHLLLILTSNKLGELTSPWLGKMMKGVVHNYNPTKRNSLRRQREIFQKTNYASCWYANNHESVAMWQIYSNPDSVAIRIPYKVLKDEFNNSNFELPICDHKSLKYGSVHYHRLNDLDDISAAVTKTEIVGFLKDYCFQHEQEFRIMLEVNDFNLNPTVRKPFVLDEQVDRMNELKDLKLFYLTFKNFKNLPFDIIFHPQSMAWHRENIINLVSKFELPFKCIESGLTDVFV